MNVAARLEGLDEDEVAVAVVGQHDVLVATARFDGEAAHVIGVKFGDVVDLDMDLTGGYGRERFVGAKVIRDGFGRRRGIWISF